jgi:hypothetical protein
MKHKTRLDKLEKSVDEMHGATDAPVCDLYRREYDQDFKGNARQAIMKLCQSIRDEIPTDGRDGPDK